MLSSIKPNKFLSKPENRNERLSEGKVGHHDKQIFVIITDSCRLVIKLALMSDINPDFLLKSFPPKLVSID